MYVGNLYGISSPFFSVSLSTPLNFISFLIRVAKIHSFVSVPITWRRPPLVTCSTAPRSQFASALSSIVLCNGFCRIKSKMTLPNIFLTLRLLYSLNIIKCKCWSSVTLSISCWFCSFYQNGSIIQSDFIRKICTLHVQYVLYGRNSGHIPLPDNNLNYFMNSNFSA